MVTKKGNAEGLTVIEARQIIDEFNSKSNHSEDEEFFFIEALEFLIAEENWPEDMMQLMRDWDISGITGDAASGIMRRLSTIIPGLWRGETLPVPIKSRICTRMDIS